jgi:hypothetical protein
MLAGRKARIKKGYRLPGSSRLKLTPYLDASFLSSHTLSD